MKEGIIKELQIYSLNKIHQQIKIQQMFGRPTRPPIPPTISQEQQIELLSKDFPLMKQLLTAPPELILPSIKNLSQINEESKKSLRKFPPNELSYFNQLLLKQLKRVTEWNIDHKALHSQLSTISQFILISIAKIYKILLLNKIQNGLVLTEIWGLIHKRSEPQGFRGQRNMIEYRRERDNIFALRGASISFQNERETQFATEFVQSIKVINTPMMRKNKDFQIHNKRYDCLSQQQKIKYRLSLLIIASNSLNMDDEQQRSFGRRRGMRNNENQEHIEIINAEAERLFSMMSNIEEPWFLTEFMKAQTALRQQLRVSLTNARLVKQQMENNVVLEPIPGVNPKLLSSKVLEDNYLLDKKSQVNYFTDGNVLIQENQIFMKYDISQIVQLGAEQMYHKRRNRREEEETIDQAQKQKIYNIFLNSISNVYKIVAFAMEGKSILVFQKHGEFALLPLDKYPALVIRCIDAIECIYRFCKERKILDIGIQLLRNPESIINFTNAMTFLSQLDPSKRLKPEYSILISICSLIRQIILDNQQQIPLLNNASFIKQFVSCANLLLSDAHTIALPFPFQQFLIQYITKLFQFSPQISGLNFQKIYSLKVAQMNKSPMRRGFNRNHLNMHLRDESDDDNSEIDLSNFINVFPDCLKYLQKQITESAQKLENDIKNASFFEDSIPQNVEIFIRLFSNPEIQIDQSLNKAFEALIKNNSAILAKKFETIRWDGLKKRINFSDQQIAQEVRLIYSALKNEDFLCNIKPEDLCQKLTSTDAKLVQLVNRLSYIIILLRIREKSPKCSYIREMLEIMLIMENIQSKCLYRIVEHQADYSDEKLQQVMKFYRQKDAEKSTVYFKLIDILVQLTQACWGVFLTLEAEGLDQLVREYRVYFEAMRNMEDRNLLLKLIKKTYRNFRLLADKMNLSLNCQLYRRNSKLILEILSAILKLTKNKQLESQTAVIGTSYLNFIKKCRAKGTDPKAKFQEIIIPHIDHSTGELMEFLFLTTTHPKTIFNNKVYLGSENGTKILRSILCHATRQVALGLQPQNLQIVFAFVNMIETRNIRSSHRASGESETAFSSIQSDDLPLLSVQEKEKSFGESHVIITQKIFEHRYHTSQLKELQRLYIISLRKMQQRYKIANEENKMISRILKEIGEESSQAQFNNEIFKNQSSWIDLILGTAANVKIEEVISVGFVRNYLRAIQQMLNNHEEYKQLIPNTLYVLKMLIPKSNHKVTKQFEEYSHSVLQIIIKIMECCKLSQKIKDIQNSAYEILQNLVKNNCSDFTPYITRIIEYLSQTNLNLGQILNSTVQKQFAFATIQSQIKGYFLRQSQNLVDESQDRISTRLQSFITTFKYKYQDEIATFTNISGGFVKRSIKKQEKKDIIYLSYEKTKPFYLSEILKKEMIHVEPSDITKILIKSIISSFSKKKRSIDGLITTLRDLIFHNPLFSPYIMMHPVQSEGKTIQLIDYLISLTLEQYHEQVNNFLLFMCLDHSSIVELKDRSIFFSQYLCYRIIKAIMSSKVTEQSCMLTYGLTQLKRFSYLCKIKLSEDRGSLVSYLINYLKASRQEFQYPNSLNNFIYLITWVVFKQDQIDNLKKCFIPKPGKDLERDYKLLNVSTIPAQLYQLKKQQGGVTKREDVIAYTGNLITPFYSQIYDGTLMERDYQKIDRKIFNYIEEDIQIAIMETSHLIIDQQNIQYLTQTTKSKLFRSAYGQTKGFVNRMHNSNLQSFRKLYFKQQAPQRERERETRNIFQRERGGNLGMDMREIEEMEMRREMRNMRGGSLMARRGGRGMGRGGQRNIRQSPFAQEDFFVSSNSQQQLKSIEEEFKQSLSVLPSEQVLVSQQSQSNFQQLKTGEQQLQVIISQIKQKFSILGRQPFNPRVLQEKTQSQKKQYLQVLLIELDFDLQKQILSEEQFDVYCLSKSTQIERLDENRREYLDMAELRMFSLKLIKSGSGDTDEIIDALDQNYQHLANFKRTFSREQSLSSGEDDREQFQGNNFFYENGSLSIRAFPDIQESIIYQMLLSLYYSGPTNTYKQIIPFLQNKKYQHQIINVLLHLAKNPFKTKQFPSVVFEFSQDKNTWRKKIIDSTNEQMQTNKFFKRILPIFQFVKNLCFYQNDTFLLERISTDGLFGIVYEPRSQVTEMNSYIPIYDILSYTFELSDSPSFDLFKGITHLPENMTNKLLEQIKKEEKGTITAEEEQIPRIQSLGMAYMYAQMRQNRQNGKKCVQYTCLSSLLQNQQFCQKIRQLYPFGQKYPSSKLMLQLASSKVYSKEQLKEYVLTLMSKKPEKTNDLLLLNKLIDVFTDEQLKGATWIKQNQQTIAKVLRFMIGSRKKIENEPIIRLVKTGGENSYEVKKVLLNKQLEEIKQNNQIRDYEQLQKSRVYAKRKKLFLSAFQDLKNLPSSFWYSGFRVKFIDENGIQQTGHGDGPNREWFTLVSKSMVNLDTGLFRLTDRNNYFFNRESYINPRHLQYFEFIGKLAALSLLRAQFIVSPSLSTILYKMILGETITLQDLCEQFKEEKKRIDAIYEMFKTNTVEQLQDSYIPFIYLDNKLLSSVNYDLKSVRSSGSNQIQVGGTTVSLTTSTVNVIQELQTQVQLSRLPRQVGVVNVAEYLQLKPGGSNTYLTADNKEQYLELTKKKIYQNLIQSVKKPAEAFIFGFKSLIKAKGLSMLKAKELKILVEGTPIIDADDIEKFTRNNESVDPISTAFFWECFKKLSHEDRATLLMFWSGSDKMPVEGAKLLRLFISKSSKPYFIAHVCAKTLDIPSAKDSEEMMAKMNAVIELQRLGLARMED